MSLFNIGLDKSLDYWRGDGQDGIKPNAGGVYFVGAVGIDAVKIGYSKNFKRRLEALRAQSVLPLKIVGAIEGDYDLEQAIHWLYGHRRYHGEWFIPTAAMKAEFRLDLSGWGGSHRSQYEFLPSLPHLSVCNHFPMSLSSVRECAEQCGRGNVTQFDCGFGISYWRKPLTASRRDFSNYLVTV